MTNDIGTGTTNLSVNAPMDWASEIRRAAFLAKLSYGEFMRRLCERGAEVENPELAARLKEVRRQYYGSALVILFVGVLVSSWFGGGEVFARARTRGYRRVRVEEIAEA